VELVLAEAVLLQRERNLLEMTELLCRLMNEKNMNRGQLAALCGIPANYFSQMLNGERTMSINTFSDALTYLGYSLNATAGPLT
jgi:transcriptional regulator with XRE-family HTH domain